MHPTTQSATQPSSYRPPATQPSSYGTGTEGFHRQPPPQSLDRSSSLEFSGHSYNTVSSSPNHAEWKKQYAALKQYADIQEEELQSMKKKKRQVNLCISIDNYCSRHQSVGPNPWECCFSKAVSMFQSPFSLMQDWNTLYLKKLGAWPVAKRDPIEQLQ